jgi:hypothetical protein
MGGFVSVPKAWGYKHKGSSAQLSIPVPTLADALGIDIDLQPSRITDLILAPAIEDLATAGIEMKAEWVPVKGYVRRQAALAISVAPSTSVGAQRSRHASQIMNSSSVSF